MNVYRSGDVTLEGASFSECTAVKVRLPRPHTLASPRTHTLARHHGAGSEKNRLTTGLQRGARFPQRAALGLPALSRSLTASPLMPARPNSRRTEEACSCTAASASRWTAPVSASARLAGCVRPHTLASPAHTRTHAIASARSGRRRERDKGWQGGHDFPKGPPWACPPSLAL